MVKQRLVKEVHRGCSEAQRQESDCHLEGSSRGDELLVVVKGDLTLVMPKPKRYAKTLQGVAKDTYPSGYLKRERWSW